MTTVGEDVEERGALNALLVEGKLVPATMERVWSFLKKLKTGLLYDPAILCLGII